MMASGIDRHLKRLDAVEADAPVVVSAYLRLDVQYRQRRHYLAVLRQRARRAIAELSDRGLDRRALAEVKRDLARVQKWCARSDNLPGLPGVAVFACERLDRYLAVVVDREHARFFEVAADETVELRGVITPTRRGGRFRPDRRDAPGWGERQYLNQMTSDKHRHYGEVAQTTSALLTKRGLQGLAVMGPSTHANAMLDFLADPVRDRVLGTDQLNPTVATAADVGRATWLLQAAHERRHEARLVEAVGEGLGTGLAVNGIRETLAALGQGQVRTQVVPDSQEASGFRCASTGRLVIEARLCRGEGDPTPVPNLADAAIDEALKQRADVQVIDDPALAGQVDGMAATLRFRHR
jgi:peptide subunit release factor 1 (eRF1)